MYLNRWLSAVRILCVLTSGAALSADEPHAAPPAIGYAQREAQGVPPAIQKQLDAMRRQIAAQKLTFTVGYTAAMDIPLTTLAPPRLPEEAPEPAARSGAEGQQAAQTVALTGCNASAAAFSWSGLGKVTPVKNQKNCGSCWAFAAVAALEASVALRSPPPNRFGGTTIIDGSEQNVVSCVKKGSAKCMYGGTSHGALQAMAIAGITDEKSYPYNLNTIDFCSTKFFPTRYRALAWGYVAGPNVIPSAAAMKTALCTHGPVVSSMHTTSLFQAYTGGVFNEMAIGPVNHEVLIVVGMTPSRLGSSKTRGVLTGA